MAKQNKPIDEEDYMRQLFENAFKLIKFHDDKITPEFIRDGLNGALSGLYYGFDRKAYLTKLIAKLEEIIQVASIELIYRESLNGTYRNGDEYIKEVQKEAKEYLSLDEVVEKYKLPKNSIKSKAWRDRNGFPYRQHGDNGSVCYSVTEVEEWLRLNRK